MDYFHIGIMIVGVCWIYYINSKPENPRKQKSTFTGIAALGLLAILWFIKSIFDVLSSS